MNGWNIGNWEVGNCEVGNWKVGNWEFGNWKLGIWKLGIWKLGNWKFGIRNIGIWSSARWNSNVWNSKGWKSKGWSSISQKSNSWKSNSWNFSDWKPNLWKSILWNSTIVLLFAACQHSNQNANRNSNQSSNVDSNQISNLDSNQNSNESSNNSSHQISNQNSKHGTVVFQTDFGLKDGAVSAMKGVATSVDPNLKLYDLTHEIPAYNIWEGAYRLEQTAPYWPAGTVFVSVIDPGVGTSRKSVVMRSKSGHYFVTPDNGTLTLVAESLGIDEVREINEELNRRKGSGKSYTFHGRDVYAYTGARLAAGVISFEQVGNRLPASVIRIPYQKAQFQGDSIVGSIPILDIQYGNVWTNINDSVFRSLQATPKKNIKVEIRNNGKVIFKHVVPFVNTFGDVPEGKPLAYMNSLLNFSLAVNMGSFADRYKVKSGPGWSIVIRRAD